jgi:transmembrane sensor
MTEPQALDWHLITRYAAGDCTPEERAAAELMLEASPEHRAMVADAGAAWNAARRMPRVAVDVDAMARTLDAHIGRTQSNATPRRSASMRRSTSHSPWRTRIAGIVGIAAVLALGVAAPNAWRAIQRSGDTLVREYSTARAQRAEWELPDGSHIVLGPETRVRYSERGRNGARTVALQGQAYFSVSHGAGRPFVVQAGAVSTRVLGTSFSVRAYETDAGAQVAVAEG